MKNYSIEKVGSDYVVKVDDQSVIKVGSRRRAAQLVVDASGLLDEVSLVPHEDLAAENLPAGESTTAGDGLSVDDHDPAEGEVAALSITRDSPEVA